MWRSIIHEIASAAPALETRIAAQRLEARVILIRLRLIFGVLRVGVLHQFHLGRQAGFDFIAA